MKTLDEVIKAFEICIQGPDESGPMCPGCPYADESGIPECCGDDKKDALHYLKEYKDLQMGYIRAIADLEDNPPLTWTELQQMEGKPVWVEERYRNGDLKSSGWWLIDYWNDDQICLRDQGGNPWNAHRTSIGRDWQAYRKERE